MSLEVKSLNRNIIVTNDNKKYEKAGVLKTAGGVTAGVAGGMLAATVPAVAGQIPFIDVILNGKKLNLSMDDINKALVKTKLADKGVKIIDASSENGIKEMKKTLEDAIPEFMKKSSVLKNAMQKRFEKITDMVANGLNSFFIPKTNKIIMNSNGKLNWAVFHEMGHAMNKNLGTFTNILQKSRIAGRILLLPIIGIGLFKRKKVEGEKTEGIFDKTTTFIKNNCGKLAFLTFVPTLLEEGIASIKGNKIAAKVLSEANLKKLKSLNGKAGLTYLGVAVGCSTGIVVASKIRDSITKPREIHS